MNTELMKEDAVHPMSLAEQLYNSVRQETSNAASGIGDALAFIFKDAFIFLLKSIFWLILLVLGCVGIYLFCGSLAATPAWVGPVFVLYLITR